MNCPSCDSVDVIVVDTRPCNDGRRRRRYHCNTCLERWTNHESNAFPVKAPRLRLLYRTRSLSPGQAAAVMLSDKSSLALAAEYGITHQAISQIRLGRVYADVYARLKEQGHKLRSHGKQLCADCKHWTQAGCGFNFPEAGGDFATDCDLYIPP